ncbi:hypothetical protein AB4Z09_14810 [Rhodococcus sp. TAF43]|uniref:hypothetical protein n=1 Tax=unclassified Rhodococcus (in: high G+C Gram-positive bacteria) TaxID=192944 RepID=UPI00158446F8|nr:hypothetical protein [Rhodococcus sp. W8901]QKT11924.1 hypothetical protein HUN07_15450 [Rhodococcus sp. W8901]
MIAAPRRIPRGAELEPLLRCYGYRLTRAGTVKGADPSRDPEDVVAAARLGWPVHATERWTPSEIVERTTAAADSLDPDAVLAAFVAGLGSAPRGRQTVISYGWAQFLDTAPKGTGGIPDCGLDPLHDAGYDVDVTETLLRLALGWSWNELPEKYLPDLEAAVAEGLPLPNEEDRERVRALLDVVRAQPPGTRPSELEKAVARAKIVPGTDKYQRYGILIGLSEIGVLPSPVLAPMWDRFIGNTERHAAYHSVQSGPRSDIPVPLAGWRGGLDERRAQRLLDV